MDESVFDEIDFDYATAMAGRASKLMSQQQVPPTPNNFSVWFNYVVGTQPELNRAIDILIGNNRPFDSATNRELFSTYLDPAAAEGQAGNVSKRLSHVMTDARKFVSTALADQHAEIKSFGAVADQAESGLDPRVLVRSLMSELALAASRTSTLERHLTETSRELDTIRESLSRSEQRANTDTLTGLGNRRALDGFFRQAQITAMETGEPLSVLMLDIDHFKKFNDGFGHGVGDQVLRLLAKVLRELVRDSDLPARYGGEELIAVLPRAPLEMAEAAAERIRVAVAECQIRRRSTGEILPTVTVSIGVAQFRMGESMIELIERCDRALYQAKRTGRNRVVTDRQIDDELAVA